MFNDEITISDALEKNLVLLLEDLKTREIGTKEYDSCLKQIMELYRLKEMSEGFKLKVQETQIKIEESATRKRESEAKIEDLELETESKRRLLHKPWKHIKPEHLIAAGVNLAAILLILNHERLNVISTKAMSFVKPVK